MSFESFDHSLVEEPQITGIPGEEIKLKWDVIPQNSLNSWVLLSRMKDTILSWIENKSNEFTDNFKWSMSVSTLITMKYFEDKKSFRAVFSSSWNINDKDVSKAIHIQYKSAKNEINRSLFRYFYSSKNKVKSDLLSLEIRMSTISFDYIEYKFIADNFCRAIFNNFELTIDVYSDRFNATKLCKIGNKDLKSWLEVNQPESCIKTFLHSRGVLSSDLHDLYEIKSLQDTNKVSGMYVNKKLICAIGFWISKEFSNNCNKVTADYYSQRFKYGVQNEPIIATEDENCINALRIHNKNLKMENKKLKKIAAPYTQDSNKHNCLYIMDKKDSKERYQYYAIRCQQKQVKRSIFKLKARYPKGKIIYSKKKDPNSIKLFLLANEMLDFNRRKNEFNTSLTTGQLKKSLDELYNYYFANSALESENDTSEIEESDIESDCDIPKKKRLIQTKMDKYVIKK